MFYWTIGDHQIVLTDAEEAAVMERAGLTAGERIGLRIYVRGETNAAQAKLGRYLEEYAARDPQGFELEFVTRSGIGPEHLPELRALIASYAGTVGRLDWGEVAGEAWDERLGPDMWLSGRPDVLSLRIMHPHRRWFRRSWVAVGQITFPSAEIERFYGDGKTLFIATSRIIIRAGEEYVQVIQMPDDESDAPWQSEA